MTFRLFLLIFASVSLSAVAQLALKMGVTPGDSRAESVGAEFGRLLQSPMVYVGLGLYGVGALMWLFVLARAPLSAAYPFVGMGFVLTMLAGAVFLNESISPMRIGGTLLIAVGCVLVAKSA